MTGPVLVVLIVVIAAGYGVWLLLRASRGRADDERRLEHPATDTLGYAVPTGQDPAVVLAALTRHGITATVDPSGEHQILNIESPDGSAHPREQVRGVLKEATTTTLDDGVPLDVREVRFTDE